VMHGTIFVIKMEKDEFRAVIKHFYVKKCVCVCGVRACVRAHAYYVYVYV